jgi:hypothetical protein
MADIARTFHFGPINGKHYTVDHWSYHRGGCLYLGEIDIRESPSGVIKRISSTLRPNTGPHMVRYLEGLIEKHFPS